MSLLANSNAIETGGYQISRSVRLRSSASAYFNKTFSTTPTNRAKKTVSCWCKRSTLSSAQDLFSSYNGSGQDGLFLNSSDSLQIYAMNGGAGGTVNGVLRDVSAWYHIVYVIDTTQATAGDRLKIWINGVNFPSASWTSYSAPSLNSTADILFYQSTEIGRNDYTSGGYLDGYLTEIYYIDGQALTPSSFGETDANTGVWVAKKYTGSYGTNGFFLTFADNSAATSTTIGKDYSGNGNNWTPNNISVTAGTTYDSMLDVPAGNGYADGGNGRGNYATLNPLQKMISGYSSYPTFSNGNLAIAANAGTFQPAAGTMGASIGQKCYFEMTLTGQYASGYSRLGICNLEANTSKGWVSDGTTYGAGPVAISSWTTNDVLGVAIDNNAGAVWISKNGTWLNSAVLADIVNGVTTNAVLTGINYTASVDVQAHTSPTAWAANFGQRAFAYTAPSGFKALCTQNLPTPTIGATSTTQAGKYFTPYLYTADGTSPKSRTGIGFAPDFLWFKSRSTTFSHALYDQVRGTNKGLQTNTTAAENTYTLLSTFGSDGFTTTTDGTVGNILNDSTNTYVTWCWNAGGSTVTNTSGTISAQVRANTTSGFSIVTYTGTGANATVGHGLGVAPSMIIVKCRSNSATSWRVAHSGMGTMGSYMAYLELTNAASSTAIWNSTQPTSSVFSVGTDPDVNGSTRTYVAYIFAPINSYSAFGSYTGNGSTDGPFVYCGFRPRYVMIKRTSGGTGSWAMYDTSRSPYNVSSLELAANESSAEYNRTEAYMDILSNGFKLRNIDNWHNVNGSNYIYAAFSESPFKFSNAR